MLTANGSKIQESVLPNITFVLNLLSENGIIENEKRVFENEIPCACVKICKYMTSQLPIVWYNNYM